MCQRPILDKPYTLIHFDHPDGGVYHSPVHESCKEERIKRWLVYQIIK